MCPTCAVDVLEGLLGEVAEQQLAEHGFGAGNHLVGQRAALGDADGLQEGVGEQRKLALDN